MITSREEFDALLAAVIGLEADAAEITRFNALLREQPDLLELYFDQMRVHLLADRMLRHAVRALPDTVGFVDAVGGVQLRETTPVQSAVRDALVKSVHMTGWRRGARFMKIAAAAAVLALAGAGLWLAADDWRLATGDGRFSQELPSVASRLLPVEILHHWGSCNLEVPERLPGTLRMTNGRIKARLSSGIELILFGPFEMEIKTSKEARLVSGRMLADIPAKDGGFTLRTPDLEMWDNGALFSVAVTEGGSDIFVFKGEVQVVESDGEPVDICRTGEGARVRRDNRSAFKVAADWPYALEMLARVEQKGALNDPEDALWVASRVSDIWTERWMPKVVKRPKPVPGLRGGRESAVAVGSGSRQSAGGGRQSASGVLSPGSATIASKGAALHPSDNLTSGGVAPAAVKTIAALTPQNEEEAMKATAKTAAAVTAAALMGAGAAWAVPTVSNVNMTQMANSRMVQVTYDLAGENAIVTLSIETNGVAIPDSAVTTLSGDVCKEVVAGTGKTIYWNAGADWPENLTESAKARVTVWSLDAPPQYSAIDVAAGSAASSYPVFYYNSDEAVPGGVTNEIYKTIRILLRKLPPTGGAGFMMGSPTTEAFRSPNGERENWHNVILNNAVYIGVYEITQSQWYQVMGTWPSHFNNSDYRLARPVEKVTYNDIRGFSAGAGWPGSDAVDGTSFMGRIRSKTVVAGFDLPTDAQWEYACRAGKSSALNDGTLNITNTDSDAQLDMLARYKFNDGWWWNGSTWVTAPQNSSAENGTAIVGSYAPNAWGLYDMHGNVYEWCLDWYTPLLGFTTVTDPVGPSSGEDGKRVFRGGAFDQPAAGCRSAYRTRATPDSSWESGGFRLARTLP
ncbi:MAG: SUMF1/EgtB/PvdO family nonheme iron enzyme [Kiritimatiellae bacterium]|nr:SUMF1/EgtB/PvdO family nonheme iron enzyme [Kiritimatiellia bacterium]